VVGLAHPDSGTVLIDGHPVSGDRDRALRRRVQMVFQDPGGSLNPALTVEAALTEPMIAHRMGSRAELARRTRGLLELVELPASALSLRPRQMSGGQRQRVAIARALALEPDLLVADEAVSALDVSVQAAVLNLLRRLQRELGLTMLFIAHDLAVVRQVCDRIAVMYLGAIVEEGPADAVLADPQHPYTAALLAAVPRLERAGAAAPRGAAGEPPSPLDVPSGCRFHPRCPIADPELCPRDEPELAVRGDRAAACHFAWQAGAERRADQHRGMASVEANQQEE
jgi:oligopeptide/dipeptide ABC transporter ATP-binding protein